MNEWSNKKFGFDTRAIHAGQEPDPTSGAVMTPITLATTFVQSSPGVHKGWDYTRAGNPTRDIFENCIANLENGKYGLAFGSGCAAMTSLCHLFKKGDHIISFDDIYGGTARLFNQVISRNGIDFTYVDLTSPKNFENAIQKNTKMLWIESPTNPLLKLADIRKLSQIAKKHKIIVAIDNTFMSPYFQKPLDLGADIVCHSSTKYLGGHSDVLGGVLITNSKEIGEKLRFLQKSIGAVPSPFDCYLVLRSLKTLGLRMRAHEKSAQEIAKFLSTHKNVEKVIYPGLKTHPQFELAKFQMSGFGGMISFYIKGGLPKAKKFLESVKIFALAESLGGVESLIEHPATMTHASLTTVARKKLGIDDAFIRLSVGVEDTVDLLKDIKQALDLLTKN